MFFAWHPLSLPSHPRKTYFFPLPYPEPGLLKILKYSPSSSGVLSRSPSSSSVLFAATVSRVVPPAPAPASPGERVATPRRLRLICKRIFALINGFKKDKSGGERGSGAAAGGARSPKARDQRRGTRKSFEFILIILTNKPRNEGLTNYLLEYDCAEFLTRDRPILRCLRGSLLLVDGRLFPPPIGKNGDRRARVFQGPREKNARE